MQLGGLHHVSSITGDVGRNLAFYTEVLGLRLVKKTVNQDDVSAYHLFYADRAGHAGTDVTFFDWEGMAPHRPHAGEISAVALRVPGRAALENWIARLDAYGVTHGPIVERDGRAVLAFVDLEGQRLELVDDSVGNLGVPPGEAWDRGAVPAAWGIRGLAAITITAKDLGPTDRVLTGLLGLQKVEDRVEDGHPVVTYAIGPGGPGAEVRVIERPDLRSGAFVGAGGVHHAAFRAPNSEEHAAWRERMAAAGLNVTPVIDRYYFKSIYFREPGGVLFEIATDGPGFATDEDLDHLGETLALPPFLEPRRRQIEANLKPIAPVALEARYS
ncbi:MAG: ring-cleaving dioxygenase [Chloroflexota bacterium]